MCRPFANKIKRPTFSVKTSSRPTFRSVDTKPASKPAAGLVARKLSGPPASKHKRPLEKKYGDDFVKSTSRKSPSQRATLKRNSDGVQVIIRKRDNYSGFDVSEDERRMKRMKKKEKDSDNGTPDSSDESSESEDDSMIESNVSRRRNRDSESS